MAKEDQGDQGGLGTAEVSANSGPTAEGILLETVRETLPLVPEIPTRPLLSKMQPGP